MSTQYKKDLCQDLTASALAHLEAAAIYEPDLTWQDRVRGAQEKAQEAMKWQDGATAARNATSKAAQRAMAQQELRLAAVHMVAAYLKSQEVGR